MQALFTFRFYVLKICSYYLDNICVSLFPLTNSDFTCNKIKTESVIMNFSNNAIIAARFAEF